MFHHQPAAWGGARPPVALGALRARPLLVPLALVDRSSCREPLKPRRGLGAAAFRGRPGDRHVTCSRGVMILTEKTRAESPPSRSCARYPHRRPPFHDRHGDRPHANPDLAPVALMHNLSHSAARAQRPYLPSRRGRYRDGSRTRRTRALEPINAELQEGDPEHTLHGKPSLAQVADQVAAPWA